MTAILTEKVWNFDDQSLSDTISNIKELGEIKVV